MAEAVSRDGTRIGYDLIGSGPLVVLVSGACSYRVGGPSELAVALSEDFAVLSYDRRGRGESGDVLPYSVAREVEDLGALVEAVGGPAFLHGHSSGAVLALHAVAAGLPVPAVALVEPPLSGEPDDGLLAAEVGALVAAGRRGDAVEHFQRTIGVPAELLVGVRESPVWPGLEALAHTLVYDLTVTAEPPPLGSIGVPALVVASEASDERLRGWARAAARGLGAGEYLELPGEWHGVPARELAPALRRHFLG
ncbi:MULTISPECIES: alpha/beta fold hydrolase [Actinosynnema]|uniref:alpha/beta fold hydrolase n=1 Tax=Actinosynnema TaxID=40566 RepID=UPI0020A44460|nr:alpha/beta hydrolase [Actinosynnema pretiosum]MCP2099404.1 Lysophospholipase, alpha-beta hydrolase superfamily [Actinosynnema pretiosum]